ncbi:MurR/RpiR family transcriptional regulator [Oceanobacillus oncorhynchi]|uniref:MurR/RpiR family transcriptional regulator n=1 Tax=Oceanobacillus oncorhynchi TaxID=545501 RepID=UPI0025A39E8E|nr:MurR/RpiR family transcriptional regulator [Oceanobacillus oncorhynchi]MDM8101662.1 MurR/RpiR family transcriptional regulator [Oceanobacillus oncorhynchi]
MIIDKLEKMKDFTTQEKAIAKYILENPFLIKELSTKELATAAYASQATVVRLCKKLGAKGYNDFKLKFITEYLESERVKELLKNEPITKESTYNDIVDVIPKMYDRAITNTKLMLNSKVMNRVSNRLKRAKKMDIYGQGISYTIAKQASFKFSSIGINCMAHDGMNEHYIAASEDRSHMVAILISITGKNPLILEIAKYLKSKGIYVVGISGAATSELEEYCDELIQIDNKKLILSMEVISAVIAIQYVLDIFFSMLLANDYEKNIQASLDILNKPFIDQEFLK